MHIELLDSKRLRRQVPNIFIAHHPTQPKNGKIQDTYINKYAPLHFMVNIL